MWKLVFYIVFIDFQAVIKEEFSYYNSSGPKYEKFSKYLTINEMVRLHFDPYISSFDLSKQPILVLDKVDKYWPVPHTIDIKTEVKEEPIDIVDEDLDWEKAAEEEILAANEGYFDADSPLPVVEAVTKKRPKRQKTKTKTYKEDFESDNEDADDPKMEEDDESMFDDPDFDDEEKSNDSMDMFDSDDDDSNLDLSLVKEEIDTIDEDEEIDNRAESLLASSKECKIVEIGGFKVETYGDYSKCPKCLKNIKSTFIIRHIKLHDLPSISMNCPHDGCTTSFTRSNNMYRHLKVVHDDPEPYICVYKSCTQRFDSSKNLREHVNSSHR